MAAAHGHVIIIKRSGKDGSRFPVTGDCIIGSGLHCEIRIHLDDVAAEHCSIQCQEEGKCVLKNLSTQIPTKLNDVDVTGVAMLCHGDIIRVSDRLFRWEYEAIPKASSIMKPTVPLLPRKTTDDMVPSKRLVAVVSPQIREKQDTSQSLRTWVLRRSLGNSLSTRSRQPTGTSEERRRTSVIKTPVQDSDWSAVEDNRTPHSVKVSRRTSVKSPIRKSLLKVTPHLRKSVGVSTVTPIACDVPHMVKSVRGSVSDMVKTPLSVTPRSRKSKLTLMEKRSLGVMSYKTPKAEETTRTVPPQRRSYRKESLGDYSRIRSVKGTPYVKKMFFGEQTPHSSEAQSLHGKKSESYDPNTPAADTMVTALVSPDLFSSDKVPSGETVTPKELKESSTPISIERPKRKSAGLLLAHFRENQELFSRRRRNSTPSANTDKIITRAIRKSEKINTRSARASMVVSNKSKLSFTPSSQSKTPRKLKSLRTMSAKAAKRRLTDVDLSEIAADKLKAESPKTPDKKKMAALLQCHKPRMLFSEVVKKPPVKKTPVKKNFVKLPSVPISRRRKMQNKSKVHTPRKAPVKGINSTGHIDSPETIIIHGKQSMALKRSIQRIREDIESQKVASTLANFQQTKDIRTSVSAPESSREVNTRKSVSFSPAPQVVAFAASRRISTRKSLKIPNISEELHDALSPSNGSSLFETKPNRKTSILKKTSSIESHEELMETGDNSSAVTNVTSVNTRSSVVLSTPARVSERQKGRTSSQSQSSPKKTVTVRKSSSSILKIPSSVKAHESMDIDSGNSAITNLESASNLSSPTLSTPVRIPDRQKSRISFQSPSSYKNSGSMRKSRSSILKRPSLEEAQEALMGIDANSSEITNLESVSNRSSVVLSTPVRVSERQNGRTSSQSPSSPKKTVTMRKSSRSASVTHQSPEALNTSIVSQASSTFDFDSVTTPCISVDKLVSPLNTTSSKKQINDSTRQHTNLSAQQIFKELVADKVIDSTKWQYNDVNAATSATAASQWTGSESSNVSSAKKTNRRSVSFPVNRHSIRKSRDKRSSGEVYTSSNKTVPVVSQHRVAPELHKNYISVNTSEESFFAKEVCAHVANELEQLSGTSLVLAGHGRNSARVSRKSQQLTSVDLTDVNDAKKDLRSSKKSLLNEASHSKGNDKQQSLSVRQRKSTTNDLTDVRGVRRLFDVRSKQGSPINDLTDVRGVKQLLKSPKLQKSPRNDLTDVKGVKQLLKTPRAQKSPKNDLTDVRGVRRLLRSPLQQQKSPLNDLTDVRGVKRLLQSPRHQKSPRNDLTDVRGVKQILRSPQHQNSPVNDLTDVGGVKELFRSTRKHKSPENDLRDVKGVRQLLCSPIQHKSPYNDLRDVRGVKKLFRSSEKYKSPKNDLSDVTGVSSLFNSPQRELLSVKRKLAIREQELSSSSTKTQATATRANDNPTAEQEDAVPLNAKRRKYNVEEEGETNSGETVALVNKNSTRGKRTKKDISNNPDGTDLHSTDKSKAMKDKLSVKNATLSASTDLEPESHKNTSPPSTRRGKKQVSATSALAVSTDSTSSPRNLRGKRVTTKDLQDTVSLPATRRGRKQVVIDAKLQQAADTLQEPEQDEPIKTNQLVSSDTVSSDLEPESLKNTSPPRTRRGKVQVTVTSALAVSTDSTSSPRNIRGKRVTTKDLQDTVSLPTTRRGRKQIIMIEKVDGESQQFADILQEPKQDGPTKTNQLVSSDAASPLKTRRGKKHAEKDTLGSDESNTLPLKPQQKRVVFTDIIQTSSPSNRSSPRTHRGKKQIVSNEEMGEENCVNANKLILSNEQDKQLGKRGPRKVVNTDITECQTSSITDEPKTLRGRTIRNVEESKLPLKTRTLHSNKVDETSATEESKQSKSSDNAGGVVTDSNTVSPLKPRRGRKLGTTTVSTTADMKERTQMNQSLENGGAETLETKLGKNIIHDAPNVTSSKRTFRGKKQNANQVTVTAEDSSDASRIGEGKGVKSKRAGRKNVDNLEVASSTITTDIVSSNTAVIDNSPPKRLRRVRTRDIAGEMVEPACIQAEPKSASDRIENRLCGQPAESDVQPKEANEENISSRKRGVRQHKKETSKNEEPKPGQSTDDDMHRNTRKRKHVQESSEQSPRKKGTQSNRLLNVSPDLKVLSPRATRQRKH